MVETQWWNERLEAWSHEGFDVESFHNSLRANPAQASEMLIDFEAKVSRNRLLRRRVIDSSMPRDKKTRWLNQLEDVANTDFLLEKWNEDASINRPWEPYVSRAEERWSERGRRSNLSAIVKRLNALDPSSFSACQPLMILFDDVSSEHLISSMLDEIEADEVRRRDVVDEIIELLNTEGIDASDARKMKISDALDHLTSLQSRADKARNNRLRIEKDIRPFDNELADRLLSKKGDDITSEVNAIVDNLSGRLDSITNMIEEWKIRGIKFPDGGEVLPQDLLDWESELPEIESAVEIHLRALERWKDFATLWPDKCEKSSLAGNLNLTEEFIDLVDSLDQKWRELELEGMQIIGSWEDRGFAMDVWRSRVTEEPRSAVAWIKREEGLYSAASVLIESLLALDSSIDGEEEILRRIAILREFDLDTSLLEEMELFIDSRARRGARHRSMLESEWMELVRKGLAEDVATSPLSLSEFERLISDTRLNKHTSGIPVGRLEQSLEKEITRWYEDGFDVESLQDLLRTNPMSLAMRINSIRNAVSRHEQLSRRVSGLDWTRDPELSVAINMELSRPDRLDALASSIPQLMMDLAQKKVVDGDFVFIPWRPHKRTRPVLVPVQQNTVDDAMEAILEEMESSIEEEVEALPEETITVKGSDVDSPEEIEEDIPSEDSTIEPVISEKQEEVLAEAVEPKEELEELDSEDVVVEIIEEEAGVEIQATEIEEKIIEASVDEDAVDISVFEELLRSLGLEADADLLHDNGDVLAIRRKIASHVGIEPRDMRLDRLLRLSLRLMPKEDGGDEVRFKLVKTLSELASVLSKWTRTRLEARHNGSKGMLLEDAANLGVALERIPGPGTPIPLDADDYDLPALDDIEGLSNEVKVLHRRICLTNAGGVR
ncbi:MAG: hypothetical protein ACJZ2K_05200 [Candidatus Poseidoniaceae archaeon]